MKTCDFLPNALKAAALYDVYLQDSTAKINHMFPLVLNLNSALSVRSQEMFSIIVMSWKNWIIRYFGAYKWNKLQKYEGTFSDFFWNISELCSLLLILFQGRGGAGAYPSCLRGRGRVHPNPIHTRVSSYLFPLTECLWTVGGS